MPPVPEDNHDPRSVLAAAVGKLDPDQAHALALAVDAMLCGNLAAEQLSALADEANLSAMVADIGATADPPYRVVRRHERGLDHLEAWLAARWEEGDREGGPGLEETTTMLAELVTHLGVLARVGADTLAVAAKGVGLAEKAPVLRVLARLAERIARGN